MSTYRTREIKQALLSKGFRQKNTDHEMYRLYVGDKKTSIQTSLSFGSTEYGDNLLGLVARQVKLKKKELGKFIECPLSSQGYVKLLVERNHIRLA
jgi:hypothetical protein